MVTRAITQPDGDDGRMFWKKIVGMKVEQGYQYELGHNFPCQYIKINEKADEKD